MKKDKVGLICLIVFAVGTFFLGFYIGQQNVSISYENDLIKTVAHINLEDNPNLEKVYEDSHEDIAYYMWVGERPIVKQGDILHTCVTDFDVEVLIADIYGFYFIPDQPLEPGMSGTLIYDDDMNVIGVISSVLVDGTGYAIWA